MVLICFCILVIWILILQSRLSDLESVVHKLQFKYMNYKNTNTNNKTQYDDVQKIEETAQINEEKPKTVNIISAEMKNEGQYLTNNRTKEQINIQKDKRSLESLILGNIFNIIGAIALITGCVIFVKLISPFIIFTPLMKTIIGLVFGTAMISGSLFMKEDKLKTYSEILMGTGFAVLFITIFCTTVLFNTFSAQISAVLGALILLSAYYMADKQKTISMIAIALFGGYLNIIFASSSVEISFIFGYILFLNLLSVIFVYRNPDKAVINLINLIITLVLLSAFNYDLPDVNIVYPLSLWGIYLIYDLIRHHNNSDVSDNINILNLTNVVVLTVFSYLIFKEASINIGILLICVSIIYDLIICYFVKQNSDKYIPYAHSMLLTILTATFFAIEGVPRIIIWSIEAILFLYISKQFKLNFIANWILAYTGIAITAAFFIEDVVYTNNLTSYVPVFNKRLLTFAFPLIAAFLAYKAYNIPEERKLYSISNVFKFCFISLINIFLIFEINDFISAKFLIAHTAQNFIKKMLWTIIGFKYSLQIKYMSKNIKNMFFNIIAVSAFIVSLILLLSGFNFQPLDAFIPVANIRFIAFAVGIAVSVIYAKWTNLSLFKYLAVALGFCLLNFETADFINKTDNFNIDYLLSIMWILYSGIITMAGIYKNKAFLKNSGIVLCILSLLRIFIYDLSNVDMIYKLIIFIILGIILMIISYYYNKRA